jgi:hypothetical protein
MDLIKDVWNSFRALPHWVQIWVFGLLVPVNSAAIFFVTAPGGWLVALLAIGGMMPNLYVLYSARGFSKAMALSHVALWLPLVAYLFFGLLERADVTGGYRSFLLLLLSVNLVSLAFDIVDSWKWWRGDRAVTRPH